MVRRVHRVRETRTQIWDDATRETKMYMEEELLKLIATTMGEVSVHWILLAYDRNQKRIAVNTALNLGVY